MSTTKSVSCDSGGFVYMSLLVAGGLLAVSPLHAQEPAREIPETKIVLRVSRHFIQCLVGKQFDRSEPVNTGVGGVAVSGTARVTGKFDVKLRESDIDSDFDVYARGEVATQFTAVQRPVVIRAHGTAPFTVSRRIDHKKDSFVADKMEIDLKNRFVLDGICSFRPGLIGAMSRRIASPKAARALADEDGQAETEIRTRLASALEHELDKLVVVLNRISPLVRQAHELVIAELKLPPEGVRTYHAATKEHLLFSVGKPDRRMPKLPALDTDKYAPLELWIAKSKDADKEGRRKFLLQNWRLIAPVLLTQLQSRSPELADELDAPLARLLDEVVIHDQPGWHVVMFAPKVRSTAFKVP